MKSAKRLIRKVKKQLKTKKRQQVGRGDEEYTISIYDEDLSSATNYHITIDDDNNIHGPDNIMYPRYAKVIKDLDTYLEELTKIQSSVDDIGLFIGKDDKGKLIFRLYLDGKINKIKPDSKNFIVIKKNNYDTFLINHYNATHSVPDVELEPKFYGEESASSTLKRQTVIKRSKSKESGPIYSHLSGQHSKGPRLNNANEELPKLPNMEQLSLYNQPKAPNNMTPVITENVFGTKHKSTRGNNANANNAPPPPRPLKKSSEPGPKLPPRKPPPYPGK